MSEHSSAGQSGKRLSPIELQKHLKGTNYPASKQDLMQKAAQNHAPSDVLNKIRQLPADHFGSPKDVMKALGQTE